MKNKNLILLLALLFITVGTYAQGSSEYTGGLKVKLNDDGSKYFRVITWAQFWAQYNDTEATNALGNDESNLNFSMRRLRALIYSQISDKFLILTHFGANSQNAANLDGVGKAPSAQLFFHGFWGQWSLDKKHAIGAGLHYWNGISRLNNQSTLNMMTLDNNRQSWATIGLSDQFARHIGIYAKGSFGKLQYRVSINEALQNNLNVNGIPTATTATYNGRSILGGAEAGKVFSGYFDYNILDTESNFLPYKVGSYLGGKKVFNIGFGFNYHPNGSVIQPSTDNFEGQDVSIFAVDAFYDTPVGEKGAAITAYATYQNNNYGDNFTLGRTYETGSMIYAHLGYLIPAANRKGTRVQPYISASSRQIDAIDDSATRFGLGGNIYFSGHHSKLSIEYSNQTYGSTDAVNALTVQAMIYL